MFPLDIIIILMLKKNYFFLIIKDLADGLELSEKNKNNQDIKSSETMEKFLSVSQENENEASIDSALFKTLSSPLLSSEFQDDDDSKKIDRSNVQDINDGT